MSDTEDLLRYLSSVSNYNQEVGQLEIRANTERERKQLERNEIGNVTIPIEGQVLTASLASKSLKDTAKKLLKTGDEDVDNALGEVIDGGNPVDVGTALLNRGIDRATNAVRSRLQDTVSQALETQQPSNDIEMQDVHNFDAVRNQPDVPTQEEALEQIRSQQARPITNEDIPEGAGSRVSNGAADSDLTSNGLSTSTGEATDAVATAGSSAAEAGEDAGAIAGIWSDIAPAEAGLLDDPITAIAGVGLAIGGAIASFIDLFKHHHSHAPDVANLPQPVLEAGV